MKHLWPIAVLLVVAAGIYFFGRNKPASSDSITTNGIISQKDSAVVAAADTSRKASSTVSGATNANGTNQGAGAVSASLPSATNDSVTVAPLTVLDNARVVINSYRSRFGENPVGTNPEITAALTGNNSKQVNFISAESGLRVNGSGELVDAWGTPFFFHQLSGHDMEIHSAGPDRVMWTLDDSVTR